MSQLERGESSPTLDMLHRIATAWEIDPGELDPRLASAKPLEGSQGLTEAEVEDLSRAMAEGAREAARAWFAARIERRSELKAAR